MKKIVIASALACAASAFAGDVTVSVAHDYNASKGGYTVGTSVAGLSLTATHIENTYHRFGVGKSIELGCVGPVALSAGGAVVFQDTMGGGRNGYGATVGLKATLPVTKSVSIVAGVDHFFGQERIDAYNGNVGSVGVNVKF